MDDLIQENPAHTRIPVARPRELLQINLRWPVGKQRKGDFRGLGIAIQISYPATGPSRAPAVGDKGEDLGKLVIRRGSGIEQDFHQVQIEPAIVMIPSQNRQPESSGLQENEHCVPQFKVPDATTTHSASFISQLFELRPCGYRTLACTSEPRPYLAFASASHALMSSLPDASTGISSIGRIRRGHHNEGSPSSRSL